MNLLRDESGSLALLTLLLLPLLLVTLIGVLELGRVRIIAEKARIAADLATVVAVNDQDAVHLARTGTLRLAADAETVARSYLAANLEPLSPSLASSPDAIAAGAAVAAFRDGGAVDPLTGKTYSRPTVRVSASLPIRTPAFGALLARPVTVVQLLSASSAR